MICRSLLQYSLLSISLFSCSYGLKDDGREWVHSNCESSHTVNIGLLAYIPLGWALCRLLRYRLRWWLHVSVSVILMGSIQWPDTARELGALLLQSQDFDTRMGEDTMRTVCCFSLLLPDHAYWLRIGDGQYWGPNDEKSIKHQNIAYVIPSYERQQLQGLIRLISGTGIIYSCWHSMTSSSLLHCMTQERFWTLEQVPECGLCMFASSRAFGDLPASTR